MQRFRVDESRGFARMVESDRGDWVKLEEVRELEAELSSRKTMALSRLQALEASNAEVRRLRALVADSSASLAKAREALEAYEAARSGSIDEHDAFVELRAALASPPPAAPVPDDCRSRVVACARRLVSAYKKDGNGVGVRSCEDSLIAAVEALDDETLVLMLEAPPEDRGTPLPGQSKEAPLVCPNCGPRRDAQAPEWQCLDCGACVSPTRQLMQPAEPEKP